jgi:quercetin dioxygenase-like cupin family protein
MEEMTTNEIKLVGIGDRAAHTPEVGLLRQVLSYTEKLMLVRHVMQLGWVGARHSHPHEQLVYIVRGHIRFEGGGKTFDARAGDSFVVPGGVEHQARAIEESEVLDVFTPYREGYVEVNQ